MKHLGALSSSLDIEVDGQTAQSWSNIICNFADAGIYQSWTYGSIRWGQENLSHLVVRRNGKILAAAQLRIARLPILPIGLAYLRGGLYQNKEAAFDSTIIATMIKCLITEYAHRRNFALQVIPSAFYGTPRAIAFQNAFQEHNMRPESLLGQYRTIIVNLVPDVSTIRAKLNQKWRNQLNRAEKNNISIELDDTPDAFREFMSIYDGMKQRKQFESYVNIDEFRQMHEALAGTLQMPIFLARSSGRVIGALVCSIMGENAVYLLGATDEQGRELKAAYLLQWSAMLWLKEHGATNYDLGGIDIKINPGTHHFKSGFGGVEALQLDTHVYSKTLLSSSLVNIAKWRLSKRLNRFGNVTN